ncbi:MAG TPA: hypothetical protein VMU03_16110 [Gammaproteobacteria bacterium]|nr:hypothetical protein [Gammaproteobacteria bacterium]
MDRTDAKIDALANGMRSDMAAVKGDVAAVKDDVAALKGSVAESIAAHKVSIADARVWALVLYLALAATLLGVLARGFRWI